MTFRLSSLCSLLALALLALSGCGESLPPYSGPGLPKGYEKAKREANPVVELTTSAGPIKLELFEDRAPDTVDNFIELVEKGFYNNLTFHRIIKDFMIQGGDPMGNGMGGPGYKFDDEITPGINKIEQYTLAMANSGKDPQSGVGTNGSQFFIVTAPKGCPWLEDKHTAFGKVIEGKDVVDKLNLTPVSGEKPLTPVTIVSAKVISKRDHPYRLEDKKKTPDRSVSFPPGQYNPDAMKKIMEGMKRTDATTPDTNARKPEFDVHGNPTVPDTKPKEPATKPGETPAKPATPGAKSTDPAAKPAGPGKTPPPPAAPKGTETPK